MKRIAFFNCYESLNPLLFRERNAPIGDDLLLPFVHMAHEAAKIGLECCVFGEPGPPPDAIVFIDMPRSAVLERARRANRPLYLITFENRHIRPQNWETHYLFRKVFTWHDSYVSNHPARYVKINYSQEFLAGLPPRDPRKFCCAIVANKQAVHPESLYPIRLDAIRTFAELSPNEFDLYGPGWEGYPSWRGTIPPGRKRDTLAGYRFAIAFENASFPGYITEKIFDCMIAGCVPIYLGAPNIDRHVPYGWVDARQFMSFRLLHKRLAGMTDRAYQSYRNGIDHFLRSQYAHAFTISRFVETLLKEFATL